MVEAVERSGAAAFRGSSPVTPSSEREANAWNYGLTRVVYTDAPPRSEKRGQERHEERVVDAMERSGAIGLTRVVDPEPQNPDLGAGVGPGPARGALAVDARKKRSYDPDPPSRSEKWDLERQGAMQEDAMEAAELRPCEGYSVPGLATSPSTSTTVGSSCSTIK